MNQYKQELDELLKPDVSYYNETEKKKWNTTLEKIYADGILLYGSGGLGKKTSKGLRNSGIEPLGFVDNNPAVWNKSVEGLTIYSPADAVEKYPEALYMVTIWSDKIGHPIEDVKQILNSKKKVTVSSFFPLYYTYPEIFLPYFSLDIPGKTLESAELVAKAFALLEDDISRKEYVAQIRMRLYADIEGLGAATGAAYHFKNELFELDPDEVVIDIGAFDGDTLKDFLHVQKERFGKYIAFEPDPVNFTKLRDYVAGTPDEVQHKISIEQLAVSDKKKTIAFDAEGTLQSAYSKEGNILVDCISLDEHVFNEHPTYIKVDAEGAEPEIIEGAAGIIKEYAPVLAISVYHQYDHLWTLPLEIKRLSDDYTFFLRPLCQVSWDLICYAVPKNRVILI